LVVEGDSSKPLTGAHAIEIADPGRWILPGYLVLTTGVAFAQDPAAQVAFIRSLTAAGAAAVGYAQGVVTDEPPSALVAECRKQNLPLIGVPPEVAFIEVSTAVMRETLATGFQDLARATAMQDFLLAALDHAAPHEELMRRLAEMLRTPAAVVSITGTLLSHAGDRADWQPFVAASRELPGIVRQGEEQFMVTEVALTRDPPLRLVVKLQGDNSTESLTRSVSGFAARVLKMIAMSRRLKTDFERRMAATVCRALVDPETKLTLERRDEAATLGLTGEDDLTVLIFTELPEGRRTGNEVANRVTLGAAVYAVMDRVRLPYAAAGTEDGYVVVVQGEALLERLQRFSPSKGPFKIGIGLSSSTQDIAALPHLAIEARLALRHLQPEKGRWLTTSKFDNRDVADLLLAYVPGPLRSGLTGVLAPLEGKPELIETVQAYLANRRDVAATGAQLYLHPNSIRYRLAKIEELIGHSLDESDIVVAIHVALRGRATF
jgi:purine catabolism regulator